MNFIILGGFIRVDSLPVNSLSPYGFSGIARYHVCPPKLGWTNRRGVIATQAALRRQSHYMGIITTIVSSIAAQWWTKISANLLRLWFWCLDVCCKHSFAHTTCEILDIVAPTAQISSQPVWNCIQFKLSVSLTFRHIEIVSFGEDTILYWNTANLRDTA